MNIDILPFRIEYGNYTAYLERNRAALPIKSTAMVTTCLLLWVLVASGIWSARQQRVNCKT